MNEPHGTELGYEKRVFTFPDPNPPETTTTTTGGPTVYVEAMETCNKPFNNRGKVCNACRQKAYRK